MSLTNHSPWFHGVLACPLCQKGLGSKPYRCNTCQTEWPMGPMSQPDFRLKEPITRMVSLSYQPQLVPIPEVIWEIPQDVAEHQNRARSLKGRSETDLKAWMQTLIRPGTRVLDLGARSNRDQELVESLGGHYLAIEIDACDAMILGDAHALPLLNACFDVVITMSVIEHLKQPFLAAREVCRVLKPGGHFLGMVGFLEPVHGLPHGSYYHHSYLGIYNLLENSGFQTRYLATSEGWSAIHAISRAMLPGLPKRLVYALTAPLRWLQNLLWWLVGLKNRDRVMTRKRKSRVLSASVNFVARKRDAVFQE